LQREQDLLELSRRYVRKMYKDFDTRERQEAIAKDFGVSQVQISKDIQTLKARWKAAAKKEIDDAVGEALAEIEEVMGEAWTGWQASIEPKEKEVKQKTEVDGGGGGNGEGKGAKGKRTSFQVQTSKTDTSGNPSYLNIVLECLRQVREIRGLDKPRKIAPTNPDGTESYMVKGAADLTDDELAAIASRSGSGTADEATG